MSRRKKIIILVSVVLGVLAIVLLVLSIGERPVVVENVSQPSTPTLMNTVSGLSSSANVAVVPPIVTQEPATQTTLIALAMMVAEKFGSFSNESNYENIKDLQPLMTKEMVAWSESYMAKNKLSSAEFYGVTTRALNAKIITLNDEETKAQILVEAQRAETKGKSAIPKLFYQKLLIDLVKTNKGWMINKMNWQ